MSIILHVDFNSFFASVEQQANPFLRGKPIAVGGKGSGPAGTHRSVVTTASREAKQRGVKTGMAMWEALRICPDLIVVPGDPQKYSEITHRLVAICSTYADQVELFSADEAFLDVTRCAQDYFGATCLAQAIRAELKASCGAYCTASIGIAPNKLVAKLAGESMKPNGLTVVPPNAVDAFVRSRPLAEFCGLGPRLERRLEEIGVTSVDTLRTIPRERLVELFKQYGHWLADASMGVSHEALVKDAPPKSIGHSYTFPTDLLTPQDVWMNLLGLADRVAARLRRQGFSALRVSAYVRYGDLTSNGADRLLKDPLTDGLDIARNAWKLLKPMLDFSRGIRLLGVAVSVFRPLQSTESLFMKPKKMRSVISALDKIQHRYGINAWHRAATMHTVFRERTSGWHYDHEL